MLKYKIPQIVTLTREKNQNRTETSQNIKKAFRQLPECFFLGFVIYPFSSLLSDSNQRPRDYKSRALAN